MAGEISSQGTYLMSGTSPTALTKLLDIKDYPDSGSEPEQIEVTDLSDLVNRRYINGLQDPGTLQFTANYTPTNLAAVKTAKEAGERVYGVYFGENAEYGGFSWTGSLEFWYVGKGVNEPKEIMISVSLTSAIDYLVWPATP